MRNKLMIYILFILFCASPADAQFFGKNKVQYKNFNYQYIQSRHFDVYFCPGGEYLAQFTADVAESSLVSIENSWRYKIKERIPIVAYNSHNDFQQTNVVMAYMQEGITGVTESFKNRVAIPFEGDYEEYRSTLHHEVVHAVVNDMIYGASVASMITGSARLRLPAWVAEGLAEFESDGWNTRADMIMRDATLNNYVDRVSPYQGGMSIFKFISEKYGRQKIGEILGKIKITKDIERGFKSSIGLDLEEFEKQWSLYLKRKYWPDLENRKLPEEYSKRMTDHVKKRSYFNIAPTLTPNGDKIAYLTNQNGYADVFLVSAIDGKKIGELISGQRNPAFEELHWLSPGMTFSPDGKKFAISAKASDSDALYIIDVKSKKSKQHKFELDGIFGAAWSPNGYEIAFMGIKNGASDIYIFNTQTKNIHKVTDDVFSDSDPSFSPDGTKIAFASDRGAFLSAPPSDFKLQDYDFSQKDIYIMNVDGSGIKRITNNLYHDTSPVWTPDGKELLLASEKTGISNIFRLNIETGENYPITDAVTGCFQLSVTRDCRKLVYSSYYNAGWDVYMIKNPLKIKKGDVELENTVYFASLEKERNKKATEEKTDQITELALDDTSKSKYSDYVFDDKMRKDVTQAKRSLGDFRLTSSEYKTPSGEYKIKKYKLKFTPDVIAGNTGYDTFFGVQGTTYMQLSDILGNHSIIFNSDLYFDLKNSDYSLAYYYLGRRTDVGIGFFHYANFFGGGYYYYGGIRLRNYGMNLFMSRPFNKFSRMDYTLTFSKVSLDYLEEDFDYLNQSYPIFINKLSYTKDTTLWGYIGPVDGMRSNFSVEYSPDVFENSVSFLNFNTDLRKYIRITQNTNFAIRLTAGLSHGDLSQPFFLGGIDNWINRKFDGGIRTGLEDVFFSKFVTPLRGSNYYEQIGNRYSLLNLEFRFPLIHYLMMGWPLPLNFSNVKGALFYDIGSAWFDDDFKGVSHDEQGKARFNDITSGFGVGMRTAFLGFMLLRFDIAWKYDLVDYSKPKYYWSMGLNF